MTDLELIVKEYKDELTQWWVLTDVPTEEKIKTLETQAILWQEEATIKAAFAEACLSVVETQPILLPEMSLPEYNPGRAHTT